ncbi:MAG: lipocalin-like domain-containing protein, partial [Burkholderiaceae bacterium]
MPSRRHFLLSSLALAAPVRAAVTYPPVVPRPLVFPRDHGAHPDYRTEWWYLTGWLDVPGGAPVGFQVTFFRTRTEVDPANPSAFAAKQLIIAHAALADPARATLL